MVETLLCVGALSKFIWKTEDSTVQRLCTRYFNNKVKSGFETSPVYSTSNRDTLNSVDEKRFKELEVELRGKINERIQNGSDKVLENTYVTGAMVSAVVTTADVVANHIPDTVIASVGRALKDIIVGVGGITFSAMFVLRDLSKDVINSLEVKKVNKDISEFIRSEGIK